jgi:hypothetical protein
VNGQWMTDDGQRVILIAHPEHMLTGELKIVTLTFVQAMGDPYGSHLGNPINISMPEQVREINLFSFYIGFNFYNLNIKMCFSEFRNNL